MAVTLTSIERRMFNQFYHKYGQLRLIRHQVNSALRLIRTHFIDFLC